jgi:peptidoglycan DL-endopeptidase CwlO
MATRRRTQRVSPGPMAARESAGRGRFRQASSAAGRSPLRAVARPLAWSALISSIVLGIGIGPAHAAPANDPGGQIPNSGVRPVTDRPLQLPGNAAPVAAAPALSPLAQQLITKQAEMEQAGERVKQLNLEHESARANLAVADGNWKAARERLTAAKTQADAEAAEAYKATSGLPPTVTSDLRGLSALSPLHKDNPLGLRSARELLNAQHEESDTSQAYLASINAMETKAQEVQAAQAEFKRRQDAYLALRQQHADEIAAAEAERERRDQALGRQFVENGSLNGFAASTQALRAVNMALAQLGKRYVWGAEGPNTFDCSGLMWYSYLHGPRPGYNLPRVSRDQYNGTKSRTVSRYALLPGDLLFFATNPNDWTTIHHVGMYLGAGPDGVGKMIHAPNSNEVVKVSTVWWSEFFAATRVFGEDVAPPASTPTTTPPSSGGTSHPSPSPTPKPTKTTKPPVSTSPSPSESASQTPSSPAPTTSSPSPTKSASPSPTETTTSPAPTNTESAPTNGETESSAPATGSSESAASTEASGGATESTPSDATSSSGS